MGGGGGGNGGNSSLEDSYNDISKLEISEEESTQLQHIFDVVSVVAVSRRKSEEEANS